MSSVKLVHYARYLFSVSSARVIGLILSGLTFPFLVRVLGVETYGLWSYVIAISAFLDLVSDPGLTTYLTQQVAANRHNATNLLPSFYVLRACTGSVAAVIVFVIAHFEARTKAGHLLLLYGLGILVVNLISADHFLGALELFHARSLLTVIQQSLYAVCIFLLVRSPADVQWVPISILGSSAVTAAIGWMVLFHENFRIPRALTICGWRNMLAPSLHYATSSLMSSLYHRSGHILVRWLLGDYALGLYAAAVRLLELLRGFINTITYVTMPRLARAAQSEESFYRVSQLALAAMAATSVPMAWGLIATSDQLVPWLLGVNYAADASLVQWMAPYLITASAASLCSGTFLYAMGRYRACLSATAGGAVSGVVLYLILIPALGLKGAGIAFVLAELIVALIAFLQLPPSLQQMWKSPALVFAFTAALLMAIAVRLGAEFAIRLPFLVAGGALIYLVACALLGRRWFAEQLKAA